MAAYYSHDLTPPAKSPADDPAARGRAALLDLFQRGVPGYPTDDRFLQSQKFTGIVYTAIMPLLRAIRKADVVAMRRKPRRGRVTFGPGGVFAKSLTVGYGKSTRDDYVPLDPGHPVCRVIDRPQGRDGSETIGDVIEYATLQGRLTGVAPVWGVPSEAYLQRGEFRPVQLYALPAALTVPQTGAGPQYPAGSYRVMPYYAGGGAGWFGGRSAGAAGAILDGREVKRKLAKHPLYRWDGYSPLTACAFLLDIAESIDQSRWAAMQHGTTPDMIILANGADQPTITKFQEQWTAKHGGSRNARKVAVISTPGGGEGKMDVKTPFIGAREMDYVQSWEQATAAVLAVFGTPKSVAGLTAATSYSELYAAKQQFHEMTVQPECEELGEFLTRLLAEPWSDEPGEICVEVVPPPVNDKEFAEKQLGRQLQYDLLSYNEARAADNLPPVKGGELPVSLFLETVKQKVAPPPPPPVPGAKPGKGDRADQPTAGAVPTPDNPEAEGSKPPLAKAIPRDAEMIDPAPYGFCPECRTPGVMAERRINGNAHCANGHAYPRAKAKYASTQIALTGAAAKKLRAMGRKVADADLGEDGREDDPHVTVRYGLHATGPAPVAAVVAGFGPVRYRLGPLAAFRGADSGKPYDVIFAAVESPDLHRLNAALGALPHTDTHPEYKPHATVAYVKAGLADKYLAAIGAVGEAGETDTVVFSTAAREHTTIPLSAAVNKAMNTLSDPAGGALVAPAMVGVRTRRKVLRGAKARAAVERIIKGL